MVEVPPVPTQYWPPSWRSCCSWRRSSSIWRSFFQVVGGAGVHLVLVVFLHVLGVMEPVHELLGDVLDMLNPVEIVQENLVELVKVGLGFDEDGPAEIVELQQTVPAQPLLQGVHQGQPFVHGHVQPRARMR